jgi:hypothetical protein
MIARIWRGATPREKSEAYLEMEPGVAHYDVPVGPEER